jgi:hypothetical protein
MISINGTTETLELQLTSTSQIDWVLSFLDITTATATPSTLQGSENSVGTWTISAAAGSGVFRQFKMITLHNRGSESNTVTLKKDVSATERYLFKATISAGETISYVDGIGFKKHAQSGDEISVYSSDKRAPVNASSFNILKVGSTAEAAGVLHFLGFSTGVPGVWATGSPGINGRTCVGTNSADAGCIPIKNPTTLNWITQYIATATVASVQFLIDLLWVNTALVVTTTTAQAITPVAIPARDETGTTDGKGVMAGILVTTATTNASPITNMTCSYTDQDGNAGNTGTVTSFPATAVAGTLVPFQLATGDSGVRSVQSVTFGTSLGGGAVSLVLYRIIDGQPCLLANAGGNQNQVKNIRLFTGACLFPVYIPTAATALTLTATLNVEDK